MYATILVLCGVGVAVICLIGLIFLIEYMASHHPDTTIGRVSKALHDFIDRLPED